MNDIPIARNDAAPVEPGSRFGICHAPGAALGWSQPRDAARISAPIANTAQST